MGQLMSTILLETKSHVFSAGTLRAFEVEPHLPPRQGHAWHKAVQGAELLGMSTGPLQGP